MTDTRDRLSPRLEFVAGAIGLYDLAPGIWLDGLHVRRGAEIVDHVVPGLVVLAMVGIAILAGRSARVPLVTGMTVLLAGFWMVVTHVGLVAQGFRHEAPGGAVAYHSSTAALTLVVGVVWVAMRGARPRREGRPGG